MTDGDLLLQRGALEGWAALAAHQLGEALALVRGSVTVLTHGQSDLSADGRDALRAMSGGAERAQRFVDDLLDVVRAADAPVAPAGAAELDRALDLAIEELAQPLRQAGAAVRRRPLPPAGLERFEAERLLLHLLRGPLAAGARTIDVDGAHDGEMVVLEVVDDGTAPAPDSSPLEPFGTPRGRGPLVGAGVSLVVCRRIAERRGGALALSARDDGRTAVVVTLPRGADA